MKSFRVLSVVLVFTIGLVLTGCKETPQSDNWVILPDLNGQTESELTVFLDELGVTYDIEYYEEAIEGYSFQFIMYEGHNIGDLVNGDETVTIIVYPEYDPTVYYTLPDLSGLTRSDIAAVMNELGAAFYIEEEVTLDEALDELFISYLNDYQSGDEHSTTSAVGIILYDYRSEPAGTYFEVIDMVYDGPYLDESYASINYLDPRGGYFEVTLSSCTDGDTARFNYPQDVYDAILSSAKSTRFLNMDTEETYTGGEEEWGKPGSVYTCGLLNSAESIILQTDPGEGLLGTYGRLLAWVWIQLPGEDEYFLLNYMVVKQGLAQVKFVKDSGDLELTYGDYTYDEWMYKALDYAQDNELGQWGNLLDYYWNYDLDEPYYDRWYGN